VQRPPPAPPQHRRGDHRSQVQQVRAENELRDIRVMTQPVMEPGDTSASDMDRILVSFNLVLIP